MTIDKNDFEVLYGRGIFSYFEKKLYNDAVVMQRFITPTENDLEPNVHESMLYYPNERYTSYIVNVPKAQQPICTGTIIVLRMSKNRYRVALDNGRVATIKTFFSIKELVRFSEEFFA